MLSVTGTSRIPWVDKLPAGVDPLEVHFGRDELGTGAVQVALARSQARLTKASLEAALKTRKSNTIAPVLLVVLHDAGAYLFDGQSDAVGPLNFNAAARSVQAILDEPDAISAFHKMRDVLAAYAVAGGGGYTNHFLFAGHHLRTNVPRRPDWDAACAASAPLLGTRGRELVAALGFEVDSAPGQGNALVLRAASGRRRALAVLLSDKDSFDQPSPAHQLSPVAYGLELASREDLPWVILLRKGTLRLYPGRDGVGVGQRGQAETYFELNLDLLDNDNAGYLSLIFSAHALERGGSTDQVLENSAKFAAELGAKLRDRVYERAVPRLAVAMAERLPDLGMEITSATVQVAYGLSLRVLFRILFQAYAEDSELLPAGRNEWFDANSLQAFVRREKDTPVEEFSDQATSIWQDMRQVWDAVFNGNSRWQVPAYGGSLFDATTDDGVLLERVALPDRVMGPVLQDILTEETEEGVRGAVDFRSLQVREFGTIYEGLLESSLSIAQQDLTVDKAGAFVPAGKDDAVEVLAGAPYFHSASGERKATGSYFTPKLIVDHLIERSVQPALEAHLAKVADLAGQGNDREATEAFWDFRVADIAMGSAHFLVAAIDKIERGMRDFLTVHRVEGVMAELARLEAKAKEALHGDTEGEAAITKAQLLRRQIARRCVYGLDINPFAVELARLAIWIHTFVPGLPMSNLDHGLVCGNSLTGIGSVDEAVDALVGPATGKGARGKKGDDVEGLFREVDGTPLESGYQQMVRRALKTHLEKALPLLVDVANADEASKSEVDHGAELLSEVRAKAQPALGIFDAAVAQRLGSWSAEIAREEDIERVASASEPSEIVRPLKPAHLPFLFPEVFLRDNPGFDALIGNPPWEKLHVEEHQWWGLRIPGLRSMKQAEKKVVLEEFKERRPDLVKQYKEEIAAVRGVNRAVASGPYPGLGSSHIDLYQAFCWRFWGLVREHGRSAIVVPRGAMSGSALGRWRHHVLAQGAFPDVCFLLNNQSWVFPIHPQFTIALVVMEKRHVKELGICGPFASEAEFLEGAGRLARVATDEFQSWSGNSAFPLIPDPESGEIFRQMKRSPRFDEVRPAWEFRPIQGDFNASSDKDKFEFDLDEQQGRVPVLAGASFNLWDPNFGTPYAYGRPEVIRVALEDKFQRASNNSRSAYYGMSVKPGVLPMDRPRIAFRDMTNWTNFRTTLTCLIPPVVAVVHNAPLIVNRGGDASAEAFLLGVMSSRPFDWISRSWVERHLTFELLAGLPIPVYAAGTLRCDRVVQIAGSLAAVDGRYADWAAEVGVDVGTVTDEATKSDHIAELDALVSLLYGLNEAQVEHVFATFHRGWDYRPHVAAVLEHYQAWEGKR